MYLLVSLNQWLAYQLISAYSHLQKYQVPSSTQVPKYLKYLPRYHLPTYPVIVKLSITSDYYLCIADMLFSNKYYSPTQ